jgi:hypothetical protein
MDKMKTKSNKPSHDVLLTGDTDDPSTWIKVDCAWQHQDGEGMNLRLDLLPSSSFGFPGGRDRRNLASQAGFVPVTADDVVTPGDNVSAKIDALVDRATAMVVELATPWTIAEYRMAIARLKETEAAVEQNVIQAQSRAHIESWMCVRNEVVHSSVQIGKEKAREIVEGVFEVLGMG